MSLLDVLRGVMLDPAEQAAYSAEPGAYLEQYGYADVDPADLSEAFGLVADTLPPDQAQAAWSAATSPDDSTFGSVTADFDGVPPLAGTDTVPTGADAAAPAEAAEVVEVADPVEADSGPGLSFGEGGDAVGDVDEQGFDEPGFAEGAGGPDATDDVDLADLDLAEVDLADGHLADGAGEPAAAELDGGLDLHLDESLDESSDDHVSDHLDDGAGDGDPLDVPEPDDLDIGSF